MIKLNTIVTELNEGIIEIINKTIQLLESRYNTDADVKIVNDERMNDRFGAAVFINEEIKEIWIKTEGLVLNNIIKTICHEYAHIDYPNCHIRGQEITQQTIKDDWSHDQLTRALHKEVKIELGYRVWG